MTGYEEMNGTFPIESTMGEVERLKIELERETEVALAAVKSCQEGDELIDSLQSQLAASQERERILREGLEKYADKGNWTSANARSRMKDSWVPGIFGYDIAQATLKAAEEVK
jgi:hypothetical protein